MYNRHINNVKAVLENALARLSETQRSLVMLKDYEGYSYEEMSSLTGQTVDTLRNRVWRAKEQIRRALRPYIQEIVNT